MQFSAAARRRDSCAGSYARSVILRFGPEARPRRKAFIVVRSPILRAFAEREALDEIEQTLSGLWVQHPWVPGEIRTGLGIAVSEIAANIIEHATKGLERPVQLQMWAQVRDHDVIIEFTDDGIPTLVDLADLETPHELAEGGRGLLLAQAVLDQLTYQRTDGVNHWTLVSRPF